MKKRVKKRERESNAKTYYINFSMDRARSKMDGAVLSNSRNSLAEAAVYLKLSVLCLWSVDEAVRLKTKE